MTDPVAVSSSKPKIHRLPAPAPVSRGTRFVRIISGLSSDKKLFAVCTAVSLVVLLTLFSQIVQPGTSGEATLVSPASAAALAPAAGEENPGKSIVITGKEGSIVGQMAKIPPQNEQGGEIKTMTEVDNRAGRDLLSVINKY